MIKISMFCLTINKNHIEKIKKINYKAVLLGNKTSTKSALSDNTKNNISHKNRYYGEYTFHYWLWKNYIGKLKKKNNWIGFCQYRKFWLKKKYDSKEIDKLSILNKIILHKLPDRFKKYDVILGQAMFINQFRFSKFIKHNFFNIIQKPYLFFNSEKRNIKFHFDMWHGKNNLNKAINVLDNKEKKDFTDYVNSQTSFHPHNMFLCKDVKILANYYNSVFPWLKRCEKIFGFKNLEGYGLQRIYGFLAERYMSYWFRKYTKFKVMPILFKDINELN